MPYNDQSDTAGLARFIDHTLLKPEASVRDLCRYCDEAIEYGFKTVCVNPWFIADTARRLEGSGVRACSVVGFPLGATLPTAKLAEARAVLDAGADEIDMVLAISALKDDQLDIVERDIRAIKTACGAKTLKVILETCLLTDRQKVTGCRIAVSAGSDFVKTSTGFSRTGATVADVALMREVVGPEVGVKASGGIRSAADARALIDAGATRIGASSSVALVSENHS
ncbi:deoxyribose-phosphate aldolase [Salinisphaera sp.]|uniref:deoxyribose-phosphate aldolase n=1 Tax=Salinisphaera sp. TaxID=1914330 RepID=UPI002D777767|nr:deoxyribose-phosphate aldolase [Salinisphaera sp.]HET7314907.1 deoxyribose-phosphate aldolase [Salinisphaera sp.]